MSNNDHISLILEHYSNEWQYRHEHYWKMTTKHAVMGVLIILLPYISERIGTSLPNENNSLFFAIVGLIISLVFMYYLLCEASRMSAIGKKIRDILSDSLHSNLNKIPKIFNPPIACWIPVVILVFHIVLAFVYCI